MHNQIYYAELSGLTDGNLIFAFYNEFYYCFKIVRLACIVYCNQPMKTGTDFLVSLDLKYKKKIENMNRTKLSLVHSLVERESGEKETI